MKQNITIKIDSPIRDAYGNTIKNVEKRIPVISSEEQEKFLSSLVKKVSDQCFFFRVDLHNWTIRDIVGVEDWLLYKDFDIDIYHNNSMEPKYELSQYLHAMVLLELLTNGEIKNIQFDKPIASFLQILKTSGINNKPQRHLLVKRSLYPISYNENYEVFEYINFFQIIGESCRITPSFQYIKNIDDVYYNTIRNKVLKKCFEDHRNVILTATGLTEKQFKMVTHGADHKRICQRTFQRTSYNRYLRENIAGQTQNNVETAMKRLIKKINEKCNMHLKTFDEVVDCFDYMGFLG